MEGKGAEEVEEAEEAMRESLFVGEADVSWTCVDPLESRRKKGALAPEFEWI